MSKIKDAILTVVGWAVMAFVWVVSKVATEIKRFKR